MKNLHQELEKAALEKRKVGKELEEFRNLTKTEKEERSSEKTGLEKELDHLKTRQEEWSSEKVGLE